MVHTFSSLILLTLSLSTTGLANECSSYDYEEKLLMKTIRLENIIQDLQNETTEMDTSFTINIKALENEIAALNVRLNGMDYETKTCPSTYMYMASQNLCWRMEARKVHWFDAVKLCEAEGARLIILNTSEQISLIKEYIIAEQSHIWIGASDFVEEGKFMWINGEPVLPSTKSTSSSSNCLSMSRYGFDDQYCSTELQPMCQITMASSE